MYIHTKADEARYTSLHHGSKFGRFYIGDSLDHFRAKGEVDLDTEWIAGFEPAQETQLYKVQQLLSDDKLCRHLPNFCLSPQEIYDDIKLVHSEPAYEEDCKMAAYVRYRRIMKTKRQEEEEEQRQQEGQENG